MRRPNVDRMRKRVRVARLTEVVVLPYGYEPVAWRQALDAMARRVWVPGGHRIDVSATDLEPLDEFERRVEVTIEARAVGRRDTSRHQRAA